VIPFSQIIENVRIQYEAESTVRWSTKAIGDAINEGLDEFSEATRFYERHVTIPVGNLRSYYDLRGLLPESAIGVSSVWNSERGDWLNPLDPAELRSRWEQSTGTPQSFFMRGLFWMGVWPRPETTVGFHRVYFAGHAPHFTHPQAVLMDLLDDYVPALEQYAMYEMAAQDGETTRALIHFDEVQKRSTQIKNFVERRIVAARVLRMGAR